MSGAQAEARLPVIDLEALEIWLTNLPGEANNHKLGVLVERAVSQLDELSKKLSEACDLLRSTQAGRVILELPPYDGGELWDGLRDGLDKLPEVEVSALASFAEGLGKTLPNQAERLATSVKSHWHRECDNLTRDIMTPLQTLYKVFAQDPNISKTKVNTLKLIISRINSACDDMRSEPEKARSFLSARKVAQDYLASVLSGATDPGILVKDLASGNLRLGALSENDLEALRNSPLAHAITLKL
jgi:hypothetical protein